jgi:hypothetical protein
MKAIFLSNIIRADGKYLEHFVFDPGLASAASKYIFPQEKPTKVDWAIWIDFWHSYTSTGGKLKTPLGNWKDSTHQVWQWYYHEADSDLRQIVGGRVVHFKPVRQSFRLTRSTVTYQRVWDEVYHNQILLG